VEDVLVIVHARDPSGPIVRAIVTTGDDLDAAIVRSTR
jgi:hypothetical protein